MSLRAEITDALDEVIPPAPMLERTVTAYVVADDRDRRVLKIRPRWSRWNLKRMTVAVAALLVVALVGGLIVGGRLWRDLRSSPSPAINQGVLHELESRPLLPLEPMPSDGVCPAGPVAPDFMGGMATGDGAVRTILGFPSSTYQSSWGTWTQTWFLVSPTTRGLFLVRARDLKSGEQVYFTGNLSGVADAEFGKAILSGVIAGHDQVNGQRADRHPELVLNASAPSDFAKTPSKPPLWGAYVGYSRASAGCVSFQVDQVGAPSPETFIYQY